MAIRPNISLLGTHISRIEMIARNQTAGRYIIDDFHRLTQLLQGQIADIAKLSAEADANAGFPKLVIVGINQVGSELIQLLPDIAERAGIHKITPGRPEDIDKLINSGCERLNIRIIGADEIYAETRGDYWLTQQICQSICAAANVTNTVERRVDVAFQIGDIRKRVVDRLRAAYYSAVKEFCRGRRFRPSNDPYFKLLRAVGQQDSSIVDLNEMANSLPDVRGV
jgi:hypothetical protein